MWGTQRDLELVERLVSRKNLRAYINQEGWHVGRGYQPHGRKYHSPQVGRMNSIHTRDLERYWVDPRKLGRVETDSFYRLGTEEAYRAPHILIKKGLRDNKFCASFSMHDFAFRDTITGISGSRDSVDLMKAITVFLNSSLATYLLFLTSSSWGVERPTVHPSEVLALPGIPFEMSESTIRHLSGKYDEISEIMARGISDEGNSIRKIEEETDTTIYNNLRLSESEICLIEDTIQYGLGFFQQGDRSEACDIVDTADLVGYAETFCDVVNGFLRFGEKKTTATVYEGESPIRLVSICLIRKDLPRTVRTIRSKVAFDRALRSLEEKLLEEYSEGVYVRRDVKLYDVDTIYIAKYDERRFWTRSMAFRDADHTLAEGLWGGNSY